MIDIWTEKIDLLNVRDTDALFRSPKRLPVQADGRYFDITLSDFPGVWPMAGSRRRQGGASR